MGSRDQVELLPLPFCWFLCPLRRDRFVECIHFVSRYGRRETRLCVSPRTQQQVLRFAYPKRPTSSLYQDKEHVSSTDLWWVPNSFTREEGNSLPYKLRVFDFFITRRHRNLESSGNRSGLFNMEVPPPLPPPVPFFRRHRLNTKGRTEFWSLTTLAVLSQWLVNDRTYTPVKRKKYSLRFWDWYFILLFCSFFLVLIFSPDLCLSYKLGSSRGSWKRRSLSGVEA